MSTLSYIENMHHVVAAVVLMPVPAVHPAIGDDFGHAVAVDVGGKRYAERESVRVESKIAEQIGGLPFPHIYANMVLS